MSDQAVDDLRCAVAEALRAHETFIEIQRICPELWAGGPAVDSTGLSKRDYVLAWLDQASIREVAKIAERVAVRYRDFTLEERALKFLEAEEPPLTEITRRDIARSFDLTTLSGDIDLMVLIRKVWPIDELSADIFGPSLAKQIYQHMIQNDDWSVEQLFEELDAFNCSHRRFFRLLEAIMHPLARRGSDQDGLREKLNPILLKDGYHLKPAGYESTHPYYRVERIDAGVRGKPKNLIFAAVGIKPEIGFRDAINNDIVILSHAENCLVYDRPISTEGLLWIDLVRWWAEDHCTEEAPDESVRKSLGNRLRKCLASDAEKQFFKSYFRNFHPVLDQDLPALIPQVYLHYDPAYISELRDGKRLPRQRMDFLMLLPHNNRVVIEIDGKRHFTRKNRPSLDAYAEMVGADRDLRLFGYEIYRFGANELVGANADALVRSFVGRLLRKHGISFKG